MTQRNRSPTRLLRIAASRTVVIFGTSFFLVNVAKASF
jgi:hypothetical protein